MDAIHLLTSAADVRAYREDLRDRGVGRIALDLEADQGSYRYRYAVSIFQCHDGRDAVVIDVLALGSDLADLRNLLEDPEIVKVVFSGQNDLFITQNVLDCSIAPLRDVAAAQKTLGLKVNLSDRLTIDRAQKDRFQRANWLTRPLSAELLRYAAADVEHLLAMETEYRVQLEARRLLPAYVQACDRLSRSDYRIDQLRQYENKFPGYPRLGAAEKELARLIWIFRELVGEHFDTPVGYILSTKGLPRLLEGGPARLADRLEEELNRDRRPAKRVGGDFVAEQLRRARAL